MQQVRDKGLVGLLLTELDRGEAEAIALAHEVGSRVILLDERDARQAASRLGHSPLGSLGLLAWAKGAGKIENLRIQLDALRRQGNFRFSDTLYEIVLREAGE